MQIKPLLLLLLLMQIKPLLLLLLLLLGDSAARALMRF